MLLVHYAKCYSQRPVSGRRAQFVESLPQVSARVQSIYMDISHRTEYLYQFYPQRKNIPEIVTLSQDSDRMEELDETQTMLKQLYRMINRLGQLEKSIILLYLEEKSYEEIAEITGLTVTNIATKISRIKDKLRKMNKEE